MLDDLDERRRVEPDEALVPVGQRAVEQIDALSLRIVHVVELQPPRGLFQGSNAHVNADNQLVVIPD